ISQTTGGVVVIALGLLAMLIVFRDIATTTAVRAELDAETGYYTLRGFQNRLASGMEGRAGPQAVIMVEIAGQDDSGALPQDAVTALREALELHAPPRAVWARIGSD